MYGESRKIILDDIPKPLVKYVRMTHYVDANLFHEKLTGCSVMGILTLVSKTPVDYYFKKNVTVETPTYGSEFDYALTWVDQVIYLSTTL